MRRSILVRAILVGFSCVAGLIPSRAHADACTMGGSPKPNEGTLVITGYPNDFFYLDGSFQELVISRAQYSCPVGVHRLEFANSADPVYVDIRPGSRIYKQAYHVPRDNEALREPLLNALRDHQMSRADLLLRSVPAFKDDPDVRWGLAMNHQLAGRHVEAIQDFEFYLRHAPKREHWPKQSSQARRAMTALRDRLGRLLVYSDSSLPIYLDSQQRDVDSYVWVEPGTYSVRFPEGPDRRVDIQPGQLTFLHSLNPDEPLPATHLSLYGERTVGQRIAVWLTAHVEQALNNDDVALVDDLLSEARLLWRDSAYVARVSRQADIRLGRTRSLYVLAARDTPFQVDRRRYLGTDLVDPVWVKPGLHEVTSRGQTSRVESSSADQNVNLTRFGLLSLEAGLSSGGRTLMFGSSVSCFDLQQISPSAAGPQITYRRQDCPWYQSGGVGFRLDFTLHPLALARRLGGIGIGGSFEAIYFAEGSGRSLQSEVGLRISDAGFAPRRRRSDSTEYLIQYVRREFTSQPSDMSFPFTQQGEPVMTPGTAGLPDVVYHSFELGLRGVSTLPREGGSFSQSFDMRLRLVTIPDGDMVRGFRGTNAIAGGYGSGIAPLPGFRFAFTPLVWAHRGGISLTLQGYIEANFIGTSDSNRIQDSDSTPDGQTLVRTVSSRYVALNTGPLASSGLGATIIDLYYGGLLMLGYHL